MAIGELSVNVTANTHKANKNIRSFRKEIVKVRKPVNVASVAIKRLGASLAAAAAANFTIRKFGQIADGLDRMAKTSSKLGILPKDLAGIRHAAERTGVGVNTLDMSLQRMTRRVAEAAQGTGEAKNALAELGVDAQKLAAMSPDKQFSRIADAMGEVAGQGDKVRLAMKLFDSEGVDLVNTLALGSDGLARMQIETDKLGKSFTPAQLKRVEDFNDAMGRLSDLTGGFGEQIIIDIAPAAQEAIELLSVAVKVVKFLTVSPLPPKPEIPEDARGINDVITDYFRLNIPIRNFFGVGPARHGELTPEEQAASDARQSPDLVRDAGFAIADGVQVGRDRLTKGIGGLAGGIDFAGKALGLFDSLVADTKADYLKNAPRGLDATGKPLVITGPEKTAAPKGLALDLKTNANNLLTMNQGLKGIGGLFAGASNLGMAGLIGSKNFIAPPEVKNFAPELASRERGSVDTFAASRRNLHGAGTGKEPMQRVAEETVTSNVWLEKIFDALAQGGAAIEALPIGGA